MPESPSATTVVPSPSALERLPTAVQGLDRVLQGGLVRAGTYMVAGPQGAGKTVLGNHIAYNHARAGGIVVFATVLTESHGRMLARLGNFRFYDADLVAQRIHYLSLYDQLSQSGLDGVLDLLRRTVRDYQATMLIVDGVRTIQDFATSPLAHQGFFYELNVHLASLDCTTILLVDHAGRVVDPIGAHADGILLLEHESVGLQDLRFLHVQKLRGAEALDGRHVFTISELGVEVFPRLEALVGDTPPSPSGPDESIPFGVAGLDAMLRGSVRSGSATLVVGPAGAGKTISALSFAAEGARRGEHALYVALRETPTQLRHKAAAIGLPLHAQVEAGLVDVQWVPPREVILDRWAHDLLQAVAARQTRRLVIDAVSDLQQRQLYPDRTPTFLPALVTALRALGVTTVVTVADPADGGAAFAWPSPALAAAADNVIVLRYTTRLVSMHRLVSILKVGAGSYDSSLREFVIGPEGMQVAMASEGAEAALADVAQHVRPSTFQPGGPEAGDGS